MHTGEWIGILAAATFATNVEFARAGGANSSRVAPANQERSEAATQTAGHYELSNSFVSLVIDGECRLIGLENRRTENQYVTKPAHAPWRMNYRLNGPMEDGAYDLEIEPDGQKCQVTRRNNSLLLSYDNLAGALPRDGTTRQLQVGLTVHVSLEEDRLIWVATIANREREKGLEITEIWLPWIYGIGDMGMGTAADVLYWPESHGRRIQDPYDKLMGYLAFRRPYPEAPPKGRFGPVNGYPYLRLTYPGPASMQWFTFNNGEEGLYVGSHDKTLMTTCLNVMAHPDKTLSASIVKYPFVRPGETWASEPVVLRLYRGDWHEAARTYSAWADSWMQQPSSPEWIRRTPGWVLPSLKGQSGHIRNVYSDLPGMLKEAQTVGIDLLFVFGWVKQGFDNLYPEYDVDEAMGGEAGLARALTEVKKAGGKTILYTQGQLIDPASEFYRSGGNRMVAKDIWGYEYRETYGGSGVGTLLSMMLNKEFRQACPSAPGWSDRLVSQARMVRTFSEHKAFCTTNWGVARLISAIRRSITTRNLL